MKLATFEGVDGVPAVGIVDLGARMIANAAVLAAQEGGSALGYRNMIELIEQGPEALSRLAEWGARVDYDHPAWVRLESVKLLPPITPKRLRCFSVYEKHIVQAFRAVLKHKLHPLMFRALSGLGMIKVPKRFHRVPAYYKGNHLALSGPGQEIVWPTYSSLLDYELELGVIIGKTGKDVSPEAAGEYIFGYTICNDFSARDALMDEMGFGPSAGPAKGKDFDTSNALGPWIVTADEMGDPSGAKMRVEVNGEIRGEALVGDAAHSVFDLVSYASRGETLVPGEVLACGAVGDGTGIETWTFLKPGDQVELHVERIGYLANKIGPKPEIRAL
jgi:2-keto-4-pentenoate hydratase/2-oxohepta-3-ene-1,7-dioic acid hydratase in catechol pathway